MIFFDIAGAISHSFKSHLWGSIDSRDKPHRASAALYLLSVKPLASPPYFCLQPCSQRPHQPPPNPILVAWNLPLWVVLANWTAGESTTWASPTRSKIHEHIPGHRPLRGAGKVRCLSLAVDNKVGEAPDTPHVGAPVPGAQVVALTAPQRTPN